MQCGPTLAQDTTWITTLFNFMKNFLAYMCGLLLNISPAAPNNCFYLILFQSSIIMILALLICNTWCDSNH